MFQEILICKIASCEFLAHSIVFKGGIVLYQLTGGKRGYTQDVDADFSHLSLENKGLKFLIDSLNSSSSYPQVKVSIIRQKELHHPTYAGKEVELAFQDSSASFFLLVDLGVYLPSKPDTVPFLYRLDWPSSGALFRISNEEMLAEKIAPFCVHGLANTRAKDLFDAYWIVTNLPLNPEIFSKALSPILVRRGLFTSLKQASRFLIRVLSNADYIQKLTSHASNWLGVPPQSMVSSIVMFLQKAALASPHKRKPLNRLRG